MKNILKRSAMRPSAVALLAFTAGLTTIQAGIIQPTATLPPPASVFTLSPTCLIPACVADISISGFQNTSDAVVAGDEHLSANAAMSANLFQNIGGSPGAMLGSITFAGTIDFIFFGRTLSNPVGTFNSQITDFDFMGTFNGHTVEARQNPAIPSTGQTSVSALVGSGGSFEISSFFDVFAELSIDGGPFVPGPPRHTELTSSSTPEPGGIGIVTLGLLGHAGFGARRRYTWR
ncbi:MAG: hypothetical protein ABI759_08150 [Candidatus Solibacter sp.]